jgi:peptidyl-prolyl cis-trans isomerase C
MNLMLLTVRTSAPLLLGTLLLAALLGATGCKGKSNELASINGRSVKQTEFDAHLKLKHISPADEKRRERALDEYLERTALSAVIEKQPNFDKAAIDAEVAELRKELVISRYFDSFLDGKVNDAAVKNYYDANVKNYEQRKVHAAHILVRTNPKMSDEERKAKRTSIQEIHGKLQAGEAFEELARTLSEDRISGVKGGDLGWLREGAIAPEFSKQAFQMKAGTVSEPVETQFGFHIIKLLEEPKVVRKPFSGALGDIRYQLRAEAKEAELKRLKDAISIKKKNPYRLDPKSLAPAGASARPSPLAPSTELRTEQTEDALPGQPAPETSVAPAAPARLAEKPALSITQRAPAPAPSAQPSAKNP